MDKDLNNWLMTLSAAGFVLLLFMIVIGVIGIMFFVKLWLMTNDVARIRDLLDRQLSVKDGNDRVSTSDKKREQDLNTNTC